MPDESSPVSSHRMLQVTSNHENRNQNIQMRYLRIQTTSCFKLQRNKKHGTNHNHDELSPVSNHKMCHVTSKHENCDKHVLDGFSPVSSHIMLQVTRKQEGCDKQLLDEITSVSSHMMLHVTRKQANCDKQMIDELSPCFEAGGSKTHSISVSACCGGGGEKG